MKYVKSLVNLILASFLVQLVVWASEPGLPVVINAPLVQQKPYHTALGQAVPGEAGCATEVTLPTLVLPWSMMSGMVYHADQVTVFASQRFIAAMQKQNGQGVSNSQWYVAYGDLLKRAVTMSKIVVGDFQVPYVVMLMNQDLKEIGGEKCLDDIPYAKYAFTSWTSKPSNVAYCVFSTEEFVQPVIVVHELAHAVSARQGHRPPEILHEGIAKVVEALVYGMSHSDINTILSRTDRSAFLASPAWSAVDGKITDKVIGAWQQRLSGYALWSIYLGNQSAIKDFLQAFRSQALSYEQSIDYLDKLAGGNWKTQFGCFLAPQAGVWILPDVFSDHKQDMVIIVRDARGGVPDVALKIGLGKGCKEVITKVPPGTVASLSYADRMTMCPDSVQVSVTTTIAGQKYHDQVDLTSSR